ncbi:MAG: hypothetical protein WDM76_10535 [Limisphaerales bacterium]
MKATFKLCNQPRPLAIIGGLALAVLLLNVLSADAQEAKTNATVLPAPVSETATKTDATDLETAPGDFNNWITLGVGSTFVSGDKAQFQHQHDTKTGPYGGVEDFHWQEFVGKKGMFTVDGRGIFDNHDYSIRLDLSDPDKGFLRAGFTQFRTWYDGSGGFFPQNGQWFSLYDNELHLDRGSAWFEAGLTLPDKPSFIIRYEHSYRRGQKDSTSWGDTGLTGGFGTRNIVPTFWDIDETRDIIKADVKTRLGSTDAGLGLRYEIDRIDDSLNIARMPGSAASRYVTQENVERDNIFNVHGFTETFFDKKVTFSMGGSFTTIDTDLSGSRIYGPNYNAAFGTPYATQARDEGFTGLTGGGNTKEYIANVNLMLTPIDNLVFVPAFRIEYTGSDLSDNFSENNVTVNGGPVVSAPTAAANNNWYLDVAESFEIRYTGFRNWSLYTSGEWSEDSGNTVWNETTAVFTPLQNQDWSRLGQKYTIGANWYPLYRLNFGGQYYHQLHNYKYDNNLTATPATYPGYLQNQNFTVDDMNFRATWRLLNTLSLVTRYDFQFSTVDTTSIPNGGAQSGEVQSANITSHIISENVSWTPISRLYMQVSGSYVLNSLDTPVAGSTGVNNLVLNSANNYWTIDATAGYALNLKTDLQLLYTYYRADNYANNSVSSQPYGAGDEQHGITATITRRITKALQASLKYGFFCNRDETSGNHNNFDAHLVYASMQYRF